VATDPVTLDITAAHIESGALVIYPADDGTCPKGYDPDVVQILRSAAQIIRDAEKDLEEWGEFKSKLKALIDA